jgi:hypothetical protein
VVIKRWPGRTHGTTHHTGDLALSLSLSCVQAQALKKTLGEDSSLAHSVPATPATEVQPEDLSECFGQEGLAEGASAGYGASANVPQVSISVNS